MIDKCVICDFELVTKRRGAKYCSNRCLKYRYDRDNRKARALKSFQRYWNQKSIRESSIHQLERHTSKCARCQQEFFQTRKNHIFCSRACERQKRISGINKCVNCQQEFFQTRKNHIFCNNICAASTREKRPEVRVAINKARLLRARAAGAEPKLTKEETALIVAEIKSGMPHIEIALNWMISVSNVSRIGLEHGFRKQSSHVNKK